MHTRVIFVFGGNLAGRHGKGAALFARQHHGAIYGVGVGPQGNSYSIPTKSHRLEVLSLPEIARYVNDFIVHARANPQLSFNITPIGCGLAGYTPKDIAPLFAEVPENCQLPPEFSAVLSDRQPSTPPTTPINPYRATNRSRQP